ncbi:MAG: glycerol-3-phosphate acyltransferase [Kouleothrix sp.]|nr:glycerol-3-phosphate acyltransferase [Kouleothrix sp.]
MPAWQDLVALLVAYALGCFATAYYLVRVWKGQDIRQLGSGNVGGRNAGRVLGPVGFSIVAVGDALKGLLAVLFARYLGVQGWMLVLVMLAVLAGHVWPAQLGFKGGKGVATMIGALVGYNILIPLVLLGLFAVLFAIARSFTIAGLIGIALTPLALIPLGRPLVDIVATLAMALIILAAHRENIRAKLRRRAPAS